MRKFIAFAAAATLAAVPVSAQTVNVGGGLVDVDISNVAVDIARNLKVNVQDVIDVGNVQVPIGIAANVCPNLTANVIAKQRNAGQTTTCTATNTTSALNQMVKKEMNSNQQ